MQDAKRIQDQVADMATKARVRLEVAQAHYGRLAERCEETEGLVAKFKFLHEGLCGAENMLRQRRQTFEQSEQEVPASVFKGLDDAVDMFRDLQRQAKENVARNEGRLQAERQLEEEFRNEIVSATSRERGLGVQGERAVEVAARRDPVQEPVAGDVSAEGGAQEGAGGDEPSVRAPLESSAKEPIGAPRKTGGQNGSPLRETEQ